MEWFVTGAATGKVLSGPFADYDTAAAESERQRKQSIGGYGRFNIISRPSLNAGQPNASTLELCFWEAVKRCAMDEDVPIQVEMRGPGDDGSGIELPNPIPREFWQHMAAAHADLRTAAGV